MEVGDRPAIISGDGKKPLRESHWLTVNVHEFESKELAEDFGRTLGRAVVLAGAQLDIGIDAGENQITASFGQALIDNFAERGQTVQPNVHGLHVYERKGGEVFVSIDATITVTTDATSLFDAIGTAFGKVSSIGEREQTALILLTLSKMAREPLAEAVLCISAVEFLSVDGEWTGAQRSLLAELQCLAAGRALPNDEACQVADAIGRMFKNGVLKSIRTKMSALGFTHDDLKEFGKIYDLRSAIFHGEVPDRRKYGELAINARAICARIVLRAAASAGVS